MSLLLLPRLILSPNSAECFGWREGCLRVGALPATRCGLCSATRAPPSARVGFSRKRDNEAASLRTRRLLYSMNRAAGWLGGVGGGRRGPINRGSCVAGAGDGEALSITWP